MADIKNKYSDETHIQDDDEIAQEIAQGEVDEHSHTLATQIREKMYGIDVRESLARLVEFLSIRYNKLFHRQDDVEGRQSEVESRQDDVEDKLDDVIANATTDSEVILGRDSSSFGKFKTLDDRLENIESIEYSNVPSSDFSITINHDLGRHPYVRSWTYEDAIGTEVDGLATGFFGGTDSEEIPVKAITGDSSSVLQFPLAYKPSTAVAVQADSANGVFIIKNASKYLTAFNRAVEVVAVDSSYKSLGRVTIHEDEPVTLTDLLTVNKYDEVTDTLTGTYTDKVFKVRLFTSAAIEKMEIYDNTWVLIDGNKTIKIEMKEG